MTAIIFGAGGQDGYYLTQLLQEQKVNVIGVSRKAPFIQADVANYKMVADLVQKYQPAYIFHLAANSTTKHEALFENHETISTGTLNILESVKKFSPSSKVFISGSGLQFKNENKPIKESDPFYANDAYSISRIQSAFAARYFRSLGVQAYIGYFFNHDSPLRTERHMSKKIAEAIKRIGNGSTEKIAIGDIAVVKEWSFAGDIVQGVWTFINQNEIMEANIASGKGYSIQQWLEECFNLIGRNWQDYVIIKEGFIAEYRQLVADATIIHSLGWRPKVSFEELAKMMIQ